MSTMTPSQNGHTQADLLKDLPWSPKAEKKLLGSVFLKPDVLGELSVRPSDFFSEDNRRIYSAMRTLLDDEKPSDIMLVVDVLEQRNELESIGGAPYLAGLLNDTPTADHAVYYDKIVLEKSHRRQLAILSIDMLGQVKGGVSTNELIEFYSQSARAIEEISTVGTKPRFQVYSMADLQAEDLEHNYLIDNVLVEGQPCILAGGKKMLKANGSLDLALSLATGTPFMDKFEVPHPRNVLMFSGESGMKTVRETLSRIASSKGINLGEVSRLVVSPDLPRLGDDSDSGHLSRLIEEHSVDVLVIDPIYLSLSLDGKESSLFAVGESLSRIAKLCADTDVTPILIHHCKKGVVDPYKSPELEDIAFAGFQEFARQWILFGRREKYEPGSGVHRLWLNIGGSAGHNSLWAVDIDEGQFVPGCIRDWRVDVRDAAEERQDVDGRREQATEDNAAKKIESLKKTILAAILKCPNQCGTVADIRIRTGVSGTRFSPAWADLLNDGDVVVCGTIKKDNGHTYEQYKLPE